MHLCQPVIIEMYGDWKIFMLFLFIQIEQLFFEDPDNSYLKTEQASAEPVSGCLDM